MQRTLSIVKPDGVARALVGEVIKRIENQGLKIRAMKLIQMTKTQAEGFYAVHKERPFLNNPISFRLAGDCQRRKCFRRKKSRRPVTRF